MSQKQALDFIVEMQEFYDHKQYTETQTKVLVQLLENIELAHLDATKMALFTASKWLPKPTEIVAALRQAQRNEGGSPYTPNADRSMWVDDMGVVYFGNPAWMGGHNNPEQVAPVPVQTGDKVA
jgi:hypothetical protein